MEIMQIVAVGFIGTVLSITLKKQSPEFSLLIGLITGILIFLFLATKISEVLAILQQIASLSGVKAEYLAIVLKVIGIAYIAQFGAELCIDAGEKSIAGKIELAGKILIVAVSSPVILGLMNLVLTMVG